MRKDALVGLLLLCLAGSVAAAGTDSHVLELRLAGGVFRPMEGQAAAPEWYRAVPAEATPRGKRYLIAITYGPLDPRERDQLEASGAELLGYVPVNGYSLRVDAEAEEAVRALPFVAWLGTLPSHFKVQPQLGLRAGGSGLSTGAASGTGPSLAGETRLLVLLFADEPVWRVLDVLHNRSPLASPSGKGGAWRVTASVAGERLAQVLSDLASLPEVESVEEARRFRYFNQDAVWVHQSFVGPSPQQTPIFDRGIFGCGQIVAVADSGQDYDLCFFRDTVNGAPPISSCGLAPCPAASPASNRRKDIIYYNWSGTPNGDDDTCPGLAGNGHGTHTSGSVAGDTTTYANCTTFSSAGRTGGDGQAPGAKLVIQEMGDGLEYLNNLGGTVWNLADVAYTNGARIHSNSWGGACYDALGSCIPDCTAPYDSYARDTDLAMWTHPDLLIVTAAGNGGLFCPAPISIGTPAIAKSTLTVGSVGHGTAANTPSDFSSPGPVFDGRLKPEVAAQGKSTVSAASDANPSSNNCASCSLDGTSMSAPTVAGLAALVREYYTAGFYATGARNPAAGFTPSAALLKATLMDGAVAPGSAATYPDFTSGYGRVLLNSTLTFTGSSVKLRVDDHREGITTGSLVTRAYDVAAGTPLRATLVWTDYPAALNAATARVNELKLEVIDPSGTVWFQRLDATTDTPVATSIPTDTHDPINVAERLVFNTPAAGRWVVRVRGVNVPWGPQPFALVVHGNLNDCPAPAAPATLTLTSPANHQVLASWSAVSGAAAYNVYRSFGACPASPWIPVATGVTGTSYLDTGASGGATYSYYVVATSDSSASCESSRSSCKSIVPAGDCLLMPTFRGIGSAASSGASGCSTVLSWNPATPYCVGDVRYNVYRSTTSGFTPGPSNRIARCVIGTSYTDSVGLAFGTTYHYAVRAEDATTGHGGACRGGNEEPNTVETAAAPDGPIVLGTWSDDAGDTSEAKFSPVPPWTISPTGGSAGPKVYKATSSGGVCADLISPIITLADPGEGPELSFRTSNNLEYDDIGLGPEGSIGQVEIAIGPAFSNWTRVDLTQGYPTYVEFPYNYCPTTQYPDNYFTGGNSTYAPPYTASLGNWAGGDVKIRFHLSGDLFISSGNWWIDDVAVTQAFVPGPCGTTPAGPPPVPDGAAVPGFALHATRSGGNVLLSWDASRCPATAVNVYRGMIGSFSAFTAGNCNLPPTGSATLALPNNVWFLVAATDGGSKDGSWGRTPEGAERSYSGSSAACPAITQHVTNNGCP